MSCKAAMQWIVVVSLLCLIDQQYWSPIMVYFLILVVFTKSVTRRIKVWGKKHHQTEAGNELYFNNNI